MTISTVALTARHLSRPVALAAGLALALLAAPGQATLAHLEVSHGQCCTTLHRPVYPQKAGSPVVPPDMLVEVRIDEGGLKAHTARP